MNQDFLQLLKHVNQLLRHKKMVLVAIDGNCAAGKTTLAEALARRLDCNLFHMDDFFLRPEQRNAERLAEVGGNVDYERFAQEVLLPLKAQTAFAYRPYDCHIQQLCEPVEVDCKVLNIIEGTYSMHPRLADVYDLSVFLRVAPELQHERILQRNAALHQRFFTEWIPMEQCYFSGYHIAAHCDLVFEQIQLEL